MRWFAAATVSFTLIGAVIGCGSSDGGFAPLTDGGGAGVSGSGDDAGSSGKGQAGKAGSSAGSAGEAGEPGNVGSDAGSAGADVSDAGAAPGGSGGTAGSGGSSAGSGGTGGVVVPMPPSAPTTLTLTVSGATSVHLSWVDIADDEVGYKIYWSTTGTKPATANATLTADVLVADAVGLTTDTQYTFWVEAYNDVGSSTALTGTATPMPVPAAPTGLSVAAGATDAVLTWTDAATTETGYRVYYATTNTKPAMAQVELPAGTSTYTVPGSAIDPYVTYTFWVEAYNVVGASMAATGTGTTGVPPIAPQGVSVAPKERFWYVAVSWLDYSDNAASFNVYWSTNDTQPATPGATVPAGTTSYKMTSVQSNQTYRFWIEAVNVKGKSSATKGTASAATEDMTWTDLYFDYTNNTIRHGVQDVFGLVTDNDATTTMWGYHSTNQTMGTASAISPAISWNITTAAIDTNVSQTFFSEMRTPLGSHFSQRTLVPATPPAAFNGTVTNIQASLTWTAAANFSNYQLFMNSGPDFATATLFSSPTTGTAATVNGLNPGIPYSFWLRALGAGGINGPGLPTPLLTKQLTTSGTPIGTNLAKGKLAVASSQTGDLATRVTDGSVTTRWQANVKTPNEWIYVNLGDGNAANITNVKLIWEAAYAATYDIELCVATCDDASPTTPNTWAWTTAYSSPTNNFAGFPYYNLVQLTTPGTAQFIRMKAKTLAANFGASLYEFEVYSAP